MDEEDSEHEDRAADAGSPQLADVDVSPLERPAARDQEQRADEQAAQDDGSRSFVECGLEQPDHRGHPHQPRGEAPEKWPQGGGALAEDEHRHGAEAGGQRRPGGGQRQQQKVAHSASAHSTG